MYSMTSQSTLSLFQGSSASVPAQTPTTLRPSWPSRRPSPRCFTSGRGTPSSAPPRSTTPSTSSPPTSSRASSDWDGRLFKIQRTAYAVSNGIRRCRPKIRGQSSGAIINLCMHSSTTFIWTAEYVVELNDLNLNTFHIPHTIQWTFFNAC